MNQAGTAGARAAHTNIAENRVLSSNNCTEASNRANGNDVAAAAAGAAAGGQSLRDATAGSSLAKMFGNALLLLPDGRVVPALPPGTPTV